MQQSLDEYRCKLMNKILFAANEEQVNRFIQAGIKGLILHRINGHIISRFIDKMLHHLADFTSCNPGCRQSINVKTAQILLYQLKKQF